MEEPTATPLEKMDMLVKCHQNSGDVPARIFSGGQVHSRVMPRMSRCRLTLRSRPSGRKDLGQSSAEEEPAWEGPGAAVARGRQSSEAVAAGEQAPAGQGQR